MTIGSVRLDTITEWAGTYRVSDGTQIRAFNPQQIEVRRYGNFDQIIQKAKAGVADGAYIWIDNTTGIPKAVGLATITCDGTRQLTTVDIEDATSTVHTARKIVDNVVVRANKESKETGPATQSNPVFITMDSIERK